MAIVFFANKFNLIAEIIGPDLYDIYLRVIVLCLFVMFGSHAQSIINKLREAKQKLNDSEELWRSLVATAPDVITAVDDAQIYNTGDFWHAFLIPDGKDPMTLTVFGKNGQISVSLPRVKSPRVSR